MTLLFDGDAAGKKATRAARTPCREGGLSAKVGSLPNGIDPDDFVRKHGKEGLERVLKSAREIREYMMEALLGDDDFGGASATEQLERVRAVGKLLGEEDDATLRQMLKMYADRLSQKLVVRGQALPSLRELEQALERSLSTPSKAEARPLSQVGLPHDQARSARSSKRSPSPSWGPCSTFPSCSTTPRQPRPQKFSTAILRSPCTRCVKLSRPRQTGQMLGRRPGSTMW